MTEEKIINQEGHRESSHDVHDVVLFGSKSGKGDQESPEEKGKAFPDPHLAPSQGNKNSHGHVQTGKTVLWRVNPQNYLVADL